MSFFPFHYNLKCVGCFFFFWWTKYNSLLSDCAENVLFVWLAEVSADQTVDNFIIPWLKSECGLCSECPGVDWPASVPVSGPDLPASPRSGAAPVTAQLILDSGVTGETREAWEDGQENVKTILNIPLLKMENSKHEEMPGTFLWWHLWRA